MGRREDSRRKVNQSALIGVGLGLLPFRFAAPAVAALGMKVLKDVQEVFQVENSPVEQAAAAAVLGAGEFALGQVTRAARLMPMTGALVSAALTGAGLKALGEGAIAYYVWSSRNRDAEGRASTASAPVEHGANGSSRIDFS